MIKIDEKDTRLTKIMHFFGFDTSLDKIVCPFHEDINPSMRIDHESGSYFCFGCQASGDAFSFFRKMEKIDDDLHACIQFERALRSKKSRSYKAPLRSKVKKESKQSLEEAYDYYYGLSQTDWHTDTSEVKKYLLERGFDAQSLMIAKAKINYNAAYPIIFPMLDNGVFRGWVCRTTDKRVEQKRKYLYNTGFSRSTTLVGNYKGSQVVVIVEGYMDWLKMRQFGLKKVVAILGWKLTANQITKLKDAGVQIIISALDNDKYGRKGTEYAKNFFTVIPFVFPQNVKDPGELTKDQFSSCYKKTKIELRRNIAHGISRRHQKSSKKIGNEQK